jgi:hypothetical protein
MLYWEPPRPAASLHWIGLTRLPNPRRSSCCAESNPSTSEQTNPSPLPDLSHTRLATCNEGPRSNGRLPQACTTRWDECGRGSRTTRMWLWLGVRRTGSPGTQRCVVRGSSDARGARADALSRTGSATLCTPPIAVGLEHARILFVAQNSGAGADARRGLGEEVARHTHTPTQPVCSRRTRRRCIRATAA